MSNTIILKNNKGIPSDGVLEVAELGFDTEHGLLFIGKDPDKGIPLNIIVSDIQPIGANSRDDILWLDTSEQVSSLPIEAGGTGASTAAQARLNLGAAPAVNLGATILSSYQYGDELPTTGTAGQIFFKKV